MTRPIHAFDIGRKRHSKPARFQLSQFHILFVFDQSPNQSPEPMTPTHGGWQLDVSCGVMAQLRMLGFKNTIQ